MHLKARHRGFTLLEVLIAMLIFSIGLLGMAGLLIVSVKANHSAYLRTQASFLAQSMADRMRGNMPRVWTGDYDGDYPSSDTDPCTGGGACTRADIAVRDKAVWSTQITDQFPNGTANITCTPTAGVVVSPEDQQNGAPYAGLCRMTMQWSESNLDRSSTDTAPLTQTFAWVFQP